MSDHDPLCRRAQITEVFMEGCPECAFIAKVREDQSCKCKFWSGHAAGVQAARDAILPHLAVLTRHACTASNWEQTDALMRRVVTDALAAIDALRGGQP